TTYASLSRASASDRPRSSRPAAPPHAIHPCNRKCTMTTIWDPITIKNLQLPHRLALAPMPRSRALVDGTPGPLAAEYYAQRAELGLLITEGTQPSADGQGYLSTPGVYTPEHVAGWRTVTDAVHARGGHLFVQRSEERRVGKESRSGWSQGDGKKRREVIESVGTGNL